MQTPTVPSMSLGLLLLLAPAASRASLVSHWTFNESADATEAVNSGTAGTARNGTIVGGGIVTGQPGMFGNAYQFPGSGTTSWVEVAGYQPVTGTGSRTVSMWLKTDGTAGGGNTASSLVGWGGTTTGALWQIGLNKNGGNGTVGAPRVSVSGGYQTANPNVVTGANGDWQLLTVVWVNDGSPNVTDTLFYFNGTLRSMSGEGTRAINTGTSLGVVIGLGADSGDRTNNGSFNGLMDDVAIWNTPLSADKVLGLRDVGTTLGYDAGFFQLLNEVFEETLPSATIGGLSWARATGLPNTPGLTGSGSNYTLVLDAAAGTGVVAVPEPAAAGLVAAGLLLACGARRLARRS